MPRHSDSLKSPAGSSGHQYHNREMATEELSEEQLLCPICLDLFNQPVSTPCGHNFCRDCIHGYWTCANLTQCPMCKQKFNRWPDLKVNSFISEVASQFKKSLDGSKEDGINNVNEPSEDLREIACDACVGIRVKALKSCLDCLASFCETHLEPHHVQSTFKQHHLVDPTMDMKSRVCQTHEKLLEMYCNTDQVFVCQTCIQNDHKDHRTVPIEIESKMKRAQIDKIRTEVQAMINALQEKKCEIAQSAQISCGNTEREVEESLKLIRPIQRCQSEAEEGIHGEQKGIESKAHWLIEQLEQEIDDLRSNDSVLEQLAHTEDDLYLLQSFSAQSTLLTTKDWSDTRLESAVHVGTARRAVRRALCQMEETVKAEVKRLRESEFQRAQQYAVDVTLDPDTAHPKLVLSENKKQVYHSDTPLRPVDDPRRFYPGVSVLGKEGFSFGRFFYVVQVKGKTEWDVGVGLESVNRKGGNILNPENGYWSLGLRKDWSYWALSNTPICVPLVERPQRVGVYVDMEWGQVSFYDADSASHIYSFTGYSFKERLFPYFNPRRNHGGINSAPLIISEF